MKKMKYVLNSENGHFLLIPDIGMNHSIVYGIEKWTNAGFIDFNTDKKDKYGNVIVSAICFGKSISLKLESGINDGDIITKIISSNYI